MTMAIDITTTSTTAGSHLVVEVGSVLMDASGATLLVPNVPQTAGLYWLCLKVATKDHLVLLMISTVKLPVDCD